MAWEGGAESTRSAPEQSSSSESEALRGSRSVSHGPSRSALRWRSILHKDDKLLLEAGMDRRLVEALRVRREEHFHHVKGPVDGGKMSHCDRCSYAAPSLGTVPLTILISVYGMQFYEVVVGADLLLMAVFLALARSLDVVTDPSMSYWTDSMRTRFGRRRPFLTAGCIPYGVCLVLLLTPPRSLSTTGVSVWFGIFYILFFLCTTFTNIPYDAMGPELTDNPEDRSRLFFLCTIYDGLGSLLAVMMPVVLNSLASSWRTSDFGSCDVPSEGTIDLSSCTASLTDSRAGRRWVMAQPAEDLGYSEETCTEARVVSNSTFSGDVSLQSYCACRDECQTVSKGDNSRDAYTFTAIFFALWYCLSMLNCVYRIKERSQMPGSNLPKPAPLVASSLRTFNNRPFNILLPAWVCDALVNSLVSSLLTYFVRYIVQPEYSHEKCNNGLGSNLDWDCSSEMVLGGSVLALLLAAFVFSPFWLAMTKLIGKRNAWLLWSLTMACTNPLYFMVGKGDAKLCVIISAVNGIPFGAKFLADAILADVIDYDEFLTGNRAEATYTMFKSFLPKVAAIPASAIPVALLDVFGHLPPVDGVIQQQTEPMLTAYIRFTIIVLPTSLSLLAFILKLRFPICTRSQNLAISEGIGRHLVGSAAVDPISGVNYTLVKPSVDEIDMFNRIDNFPGRTPVKWMLDGVPGYKKLVTKAKLQFVFGCLFSVGAIAGVSLTWTYLSEPGWCWYLNGTQGVDAATESQCVGGVPDSTWSIYGSTNSWMTTSCQVANGDHVFAPDQAACNATGTGSVWVEASLNVSFLPVLFLVLFGVSITLIVLGAGRLYTARKLRDSPASIDLLEKMQSIRLEFR